MGYWWTFYASNFVSKAVENRDQHHRRAAGTQANPESDICRNGMAQTHVGVLPRETHISLHTYIHTYMNIYILFRLFEEKNQENIIFVRPFGRWVGSSGDVSYVLFATITV